MLLYLQIFTLREAFFNSLMAGLISSLAELNRTEEGNGRAIGRDRGECCLIFSQYE